MPAHASFPASENETKNKPQDKSSEKPEKSAPWWKKMFSGKPVSEDSTEKEASDPLIAPRQENTRAPKLDELQMRHQELMSRMKELCDRIELDKSRPIEVGNANTLPPIPLETIEALNTTQQDVNSALQRLSGHLQESHTGQGRMVESLDRVDLTLGSVRSSTDRSVQVMEKVHSAADTMGMKVNQLGSHIDQSHGKFEKLFSQMQEAERGFVEEFAKLQKRSTWLNIGLTTAVVLSVVVLGILVLTTR